MSDAGYSKRAVNRKIVDVGVYPARLVGRVVINGDTTLVTDAVAQTIRQSRELVHVDGVHRVLHVETRPKHTR